MATSEQPSLAERLAIAAASAVLDIRPDVERNPTAVRSVVVELQLSRQQQILEADAYVQKRVSVNQILELPSARRAP